MAAPTSRTRRARRLGITVLTAVGASALAFAPAALADPVTDLKIRAATLVDQIAANSTYVTALGQQYDAAQLRLQEAQRGAADARTSADLLRRRIAQIKALVAQRAASTYRAEVAGQSQHPLGLRTAEELSVAAKYAAQQAARDNGNLEQLNSEINGLARQERQAQQDQAEADLETHHLALVKQQLNDANTQRIGLLSQIQGGLAVLLPDAQQRRTAAELSAALALYAPGYVDSGDPALFPNLPAGPAATVAIAYARAQLGKPYLYAAVGPNSFDCSGLVMAAYAFAGVSLPHYSGAQYASLPHVPLSAMQPGDLVFWGPGGSAHVAIYLGAARIIEEGGTGNDVHIGPIWGQPFGAARVL